MPIYEYQCAACGHRLEKLQKVSDPRLTTCPACNEEALAKLISPAAFRLKGNGWYETDFKTGKKRNLIGDPSSAAGGAGGEGASAGGASDSSSKESTGSDKSATDSKPASAATANSNSADN